MSDPQAEMPKYRCHKVVHALKIQRLAHDYGRLRLYFDLETFAPAIIGIEDAPRFKTTSTDLGYYVVYEDGYESWSPTKAFEDGYTLIED